jgi:acyl-CoA reductase-like NAD-dependent aldehyde dehydrogenase
MQVLARYWAQYLINISISNNLQTGELLASHVKIAKISFTGSIGSGRKVQQAASKSNLKVVTLELGNTLSNAILPAPSN